MKTVNFSLDRLAERWAHYSVGPQADPLMRERSSYNFKATAFHLATTVLIISIAWAFFSPVALLAVALSGVTRSAVLKNIQRKEVSTDLCRVLECVVLLRLFSRKQLSETSPVRLPVQGLSIGGEVLDSPTDSPRSASPQLTPASSPYGSPNPAIAGLPSISGGFYSPMRVLSGSACPPGSALRF